MYVMRLMIYLSNYLTYFSGNESPIYTFSSSTNQKLKFAPAAAFMLHFQKRKREVSGAGSKQRSSKPKSMDTVSDKVFHYPRHIRKFRPQDLDDVIKLTEAKIRHVDLKTKEWDLAYKMKHNREPIPVPENPY